MNKNIVLILILILGLSIPAVHAQEKFTISLGADLGLTDAYSTTYAGGISEKSNRLNSYGPEFSWTFWETGNNSLAVGLGFRIADVSFKNELGKASFSYEAGPEADMDGNSYIRHTEISGLSQSASLVRMSVPVFVRYEYRFHPRWAVYVRAGAAVGFGGKISVRNTGGKTDSYGVFPEYGDLVMDDEWLDCFGPRSTKGIPVTGSPSPKADVAVLAGAGLAFNVYKPLYLTLGLSYEAGLTDMVKGDGLRTDDLDTSSAVPIYYTTDSGLRSSSLMQALEKCRLNRLGLNIGLELRF